MSSISLSSKKYSLQIEPNLNQNISNFLTSKNNAMCPLDYLDKCDNFLAVVEEQGPYMKEFNSYVYLVSSCSQGNFDEEAAISRITTAQIITNECD